MTALTDPVERVRAALLEAGMTTAELAESDLRVTGSAGRRGVSNYGLWLPGDLFSKACALDIAGREGMDAPMLCRDHASTINGHKCALVTAAEALLGHTCGRAS